MPWDLFISPIIVPDFPSSLTARGTVSRLTDHVANPAATAIVKPQMSSHPTGLGTLLFWALLPALVYALSPSPIPDLANNAWYAQSAY